MNVKGTALTTTRDFVRTKHQSKYNGWLDSLPAESKSLFSGTIDATKWYPIKEGYLNPINKVVQMFYGNDPRKGGDAIGRYSAEIALKGFYKVFLLVASPSYLIKRASKIFSTFYDPSEIGVVEKGPNEAMLKIIKFDQIDTALEYRIAGWVNKALELANCKNPGYSIGKSLASGGDCTEITFKWE